jgi:SAM-dependent methyltransferase
MLRKIYNTVREQGVVGAMHAARRIVAPARARCLGLCRQLVQGGAGLEVGGPSGVFGARGVLPLYADVASLDNCNFASQTTWEGTIREGRTYRFAKDKEPGTQYVAETTDLGRIASGSYDFLLSSHVLEHSANALRALSEWIRVIKDDGVLVLLIPHKDGTFDHRRPVTTLEHLIDDFESGVKEDDLTHLEEILHLHDLKRDPEAGSPEAFRRRSQANLENRCLHHHVFDMRLVARLLDHLGLQILAIEAMRPNHIVAVARKPGGGRHADNGSMLADLPRHQLLSPFPSDRASASLPSPARS